MITRSVLRAVRCASCGLLLAGGAVACESLADPVLGAYNAQRMDAPNRGVLLPDEFSRSETSTAAIDRPALSLQAKSTEVRIDPAAPEHWAGLDDLSAYGVVAISDLLSNNDNTSADPPRAPAAGGERVRAGGRTDRASYAQLFFWEAADGALRVTRDSLFDGGDMASFSVAGMAVNVVLKNHSLIFNGHDVSLPMTSNAMQSADVSVAAAPVQVPAAASQGYGPGSEITLSKLREVLTHPLTIFIGVVGFALWLFVQMWGLVHERAN